MTKGRKKIKKKEWEKGKMYKEKENRRKREKKKWTEINGKRYRNALRHGQRQKY